MAFLLHSSALFSSRPSLGGEGEVLLSLEEVCLPSVLLPQDGVLVIRCEGTFHALFLTERLPYLHRPHRRGLETRLAFDFVF